LACLYPFTRSHTTGINTYDMMRYLPTSTLTDFLRY
jgi:hypothetical protein